MTPEEFYGDAFPSIQKARQQLLCLVSAYPARQSREETQNQKQVQLPQYAVQDELKSIVYCCSRIKSPESTLEKLSRRGLSQDLDTALRELYDIVGIRVICAFAEDVYQVADWLAGRPEIEVIQTKDYLTYPKPNGYRSYHMQIRIRKGEGNGVQAEIQMRTIAIDFWATLEHQLKYKREIPHENLIRAELKRCADEIASIDLSMQTIRDILCKEPGEHT